MYQMSKHQLLTLIYDIHIKSNFTGTILNLLQQPKTQIKPLQLYYETPLLLLITFFYFTYKRSK
jgi:hypothetical protein